MPTYLLRHKKRAFRRGNSIGGVGNDASRKCKGCGQKRVVWYDLVDAERRRRKLDVVRDNVIYKAGVPGSIKCNIAIINWGEEGGEGGGERREMISKVRL